MSKIPDLFWKSVTLNAIDLEKKFANEMSFGRNFLYLYMLVYLVFTFKFIALTLIHSYWSIFTIIRKPDVFHFAF